MWDLVLMKIWFVWGSIVCFRFDGASANRWHGHCIDNVTHVWQNLRQSVWKKSLSMNFVEIVDEVGITSFWCFGSVEVLNFRVRKVEVWLKFIWEIYNIIVIVIVTQGRKYSIIVFEWGNCGFGTHFLHFWMMFWCLRESVFFSFSDPYDWKTVLFKWHDFT